MADTPDLSYPIGKFVFEGSVSQAQREQHIRDIEACPAFLRAAVKGLDAGRLETPYRPGGWTVRQTVNHVADSHMNGYIRAKLTVTEDEPTIKPYNEKLWAETKDGKHGDIEVSLGLLEAVHHRWALFLKSLSPADFSRMLMHPESGRQPLDRLVALYAWHGKHHTAHITRLRERSGW